MSSDRNNTPTDRPPAFPNGVNPNAQKPAQPHPPKRPRPDGNYSDINHVALWERGKRRAAKQQSTSELSLLQEVFFEAEANQYEQAFENNDEFEYLGEGPILQEIFQEAESEFHTQEFEDPIPDSQLWARSRDRQVDTRREGNGQPPSEPPPAQRPVQLQAGRANAPWAKEEQLPLPFDDDEEPVTIPLPDRAPQTQRSPGNPPPTSRRTAPTRRDIPPMPPPSSGSATTNRMQPPPATQNRNQRPIQSQAKPAPQRQPQRQAPPPKAPPRQQAQRQPPKPPKPQPPRQPKGKKRELEMTLIDEIFLEQETYPIY